MKEIAKIEIVRKCLAVIKEKRIYTAIIAAKTIVASENPAILFEIK